MEARGLLHPFFSPFCVGCGYVGLYICPSCEKKLKTTKSPRCFYCRKKSLLGLTHPQCKKKYGVDGFVSTYEYNALFKRIIHTVKYAGAYKVLEDLFRIPTPSIIEVFVRWNRLAPFVIQPVPLHAQKEKKRGFNQSDHISRFCSYVTKQKILSLLQRQKDTVSQASLKDVNKRRSNMSGAFLVSQTNLPKNVLLVDDVVTTGSTVKECTKTLKMGGVQTVFVMSLAQG